MPFITWQSKITKEFETEITSNGTVDKFDNGIYPFSNNENRQKMLTSKKYTHKEKHQKSKQKSYHIFLNRIVPWQVSERARHWGAHWKGLVLSVSKLYHALITDKFPFKDARSFIWTLTTAADIYVLLIIAKETYSNYWFSACLKIMIYFLYFAIIQFLELIAY